MSPKWPVLSDSQRLAWLRLIRTPRVGPALFRDLVNHFGSAQAALDHLPAMAERRGKPLQAPDEAEARREIDEARALGAQFLAVGEPGYPDSLAHTDRPPPLLCALIENHDVATRPAIGIVGSRNASAGGLNLARSMARELGEAGFAIVSGLARGVDAAAHLGSLKTGTLAFLAGGLARPYPPEHGDLMLQIAAQGGAVYCETPLTWTARAQDFPRRNRLVAGSCLGLVVVEAARRSGSLITARQANEIGRVVMAVPGFPLDPRSEGPNQLIREGARLVRDACDVSEEIRPMLQASREGDLFSPRASSQPGAHFAELGHDPAIYDEDPPTTLPDDAEHALARAMGHSPASADELIAATGIPTSVVRAWLLEHELTDQIVRSPGDRFAWNPERDRG